MTYRKQNLLFIETVNSGSYRISGPQTCRLIGPTTRTHTSPFNSIVMSLGLGLGKSQLGHELKRLTPFRIKLKWGSLNSRE